MDMDMKSLPVFSTLLVLSAVQSMVPSCAFCYYTFPSQIKKNLRIKRKWPGPPTVQHGTPDSNEGGSAMLCTTLGTNCEWDAYKSSMNEVLSASKTFQRKDAEEDKDAIREYLLRRGRNVTVQLPSLTSGKSNGEEREAIEAGETLRSELEEQRANFLQHSGLTPSQHKLAIRVLGYLGNHCAKKKTGLSLRVGWEKIKELGCVPRENILSTYLYGIALAEGEEHSSAAEDDDLPEQVATFHDTLFQPTEKTLTLRIKACVAKGDVTGAERLFDIVPGENTDDYKLRTYLPVLELYCKKGDIKNALKLYKSMRGSSGVHFNAENYVMLISAIAENGFFRNNSPSIEGAEDAGYSPGKGGELLNTLISEMADDVLSITPLCATRLRKAFTRSFASRSGVPDTTTDDVPLLNEKANGEELVVDRVSVDNETAICPRTEVTLRLIALDRKQRLQLHDTLVNMAELQYEEFNEKLKKRNQSVEEKDAGYAAAQIRNFVEWIDGREGEPFTAIVDGANVAFFGRGIVDYGHIRTVVQELEAMGERPLVIMPSKYLQRKFHIRRGTVQELSDNDMEQIRVLLEKEQLYEVPKRCLDDYYWMIASVSDQTASRGNVDIDVPPNKEGRWPGIRPILITNDQMRDHKIELLEPRLFRRWVSCFIMKYDFTPVVDDKWDERRVVFSPAEHFSREIQGNPCPDNGKSIVYHFPVSEWDKYDRFCIRLPTSP